MAQVKDSYGYAVLGEKTGKLIKLFDLDAVIKHSPGLKKFGDECVTCALFNANFSSIDDFNYFFFDLLIKTGLEERIPSDEGIIVKFYHKTKKVNNNKEMIINNFDPNFKDGYLYVLPVLLKQDYDAILSSDGNSSNVISDIRNPLLGLIKLGIILGENCDKSVMISKDFAISKNIGHIYDIYNDLELLRNSKSYNESKGLLETIYRNLVKNKYSQVDYLKVADMFELLDDKINRNYQTKATDEQIKIVSDIRKYFLKLFKEFDFSCLRFSHYDKSEDLFKDVFNYIDSLVKNGPYYYDNFDKDIYNNLSNTNKLKFIYEFFSRLKFKGELSGVNLYGKSITSFNNSFLTKLMDTISLIKENNKEKTLDNSFQRDR